MKGILFILLSLGVTFSVSAKPSKSRSLIQDEPCRLAEGGIVDQQAKAIIIQRGDRVIAGVNHLEDAIGLMEELKKAGQCKPAQQECNLAGEGVVGGAWESHRILLDGQPVAGGRDLGTVMAKLSALRDSGTCTF
ncbi:MAG: hypothetical protein KF789_03355 [Bdellovibrionaceae bacterium]|nr:hypothetical protein [Pseudobdellovibrionaceae bacterium]